MGADAVPGEPGRRGARWTRLLQRRTTGGAILPQLDGLRFVAIGAVLLFHVEALVGGRADLPDGPAPLAGDPVHEILSVGYFGVPLFFLISGFILALPFARARLLDAPRPSLRAYFLRRLTRLEPPYVACMVTLALVLVVIEGSPVRLVAERLASSLAYLHQAIHGEPSLINHVAWSLEIEVQFYLVAPLLATVFSLRPAPLRRLALAGAAVLAAWAQRFADVQLEHGSALHHEIHFFLAGFLLADLFVLDGWGEPSSLPWAWDAAAAASVLLSLGLLVDASVKAPGAFHAMHQDHPHVPLAALLFVGCAAAFRGRAARRLLALPPVFLIGGTCYTLYLWHPAIMAGTARFAGLPEGASHASNVVMACALLLPVTIGAGLVLFVLLEKPFMDPAWPRRVREAVRRSVGRAG